MRYSNAPKIKVDSQELPEKFRELLWIMYNVRKYKKIWDEKYGVENRKRLQAWEEKADKFIEQNLVRDDDEKPLNSKNNENQD